MVITKEGLFSKIYEILHNHGKEIEAAIKMIPQAVQSFIDYNNAAVNHFKAEAKIRDKHVANLDLHNFVLKTQKEQIEKAIAHQNQVVIVQQAIDETPDESIPEGQIYG